jgi:hypothetical protein
VKNGQRCRDDLRHGDEPSKNQLRGLSYKIQ